MPFDPIPFTRQPDNPVIAAIDRALERFGTHGEGWCKGPWFDHKRCVMNMLNDCGLRDTPAIDALYGALPFRAQERAWWWTVMPASSRFMAIVRYNDAETTTFNDIRALLLRARSAVRIEQ